MKKGLEKSNLNSLLIKMVEYVNHGVSLSLDDLQSKNKETTILQTGIIPPPQNTFSKVKEENDSYYVLNCGGTNWEASNISIGVDGVKTIVQKKTILFDNPKSRIYSSLSEFVNRIIESLDHLALENEKNIKTLAIVLGFPQESKKIGLDYDIKLINNTLTKGWYVGGDIDQYLGQLIRKTLKKRNIEVNRIIFGNDAALMMWDHSIEYNEIEKIAPIGGVWGSGMNLGIVHPIDKSQILNTEMGQAQPLLTDYDYQLFEKMQEIKCTLPQKAEHELFVGGDYLLILFTASILDLIDNKELKTKLQLMCGSKGNSELVSKLRAIDSRKACIELLEIEISNKDYSLLKDTAESVFKNLENKIALMIAGCVISCELNEKTNWVIPVEGSVIEKGEGVFENVHTILGELLPNHSIRLAKASGKNALAILSAFLNLQNK